MRYKQETTFFSNLWLKILWWISSLLCVNYMLSTSYFSRYFWIPRLSPVHLQLQTYIQFWAFPFLLWRQVLWPCRLYEKEEVFQSYDTSSVSGWHWQLLCLLPAWQVSTLSHTDCTWVPQMSPAECPASEFPEIISGSGSTYFIISQPCSQTPTNSLAICPLVHNW